MSETNKSLRIKTSVNDNNVFVNLNQTYDTFEILSLKLKQTDMYKLHSANYGVIVGRVLANGNFGVPNAKISVFIEGNFEDEEIANIYPYTSTASEDRNGVRYNLLPDDKIDDCHQVIGTFPKKTYLLDNDILIEVFEKYYKYTTRTNNSGDYIIMGVPTGNLTIHMDLDLSDCGILSQRPRDFVYKGYTIEQFENANQFKKDGNLDSLSQVFSQDQVVNVISFWGNEYQGETIGITRADININFKFEPTCVFIGSVVADNASNGISKKCIPTNQMGLMEELTTGEGTIEMIRYNTQGEIEEFQIKGTQLINGNGVWCYQIPMNLDYMMTDEYGNMVPTDDPEKGIPTRTRVRFRVSMHDMEKNTDNYFRAKVLIPHNPQTYSGNTTEHEDYDYEFGSKTREDSFRDLLWNNVYTVKSYIPRFQKSKSKKETQRFTGIKGCNHFGNNNPIPYNNIRIKLPLIFTFLCILIKAYIVLTRTWNNVLSWLGWMLARIGDDKIPLLITSARPFWKLFRAAQNLKLSVLNEGICPDIENWYFAPCTQKSVGKIDWAKSKKEKYCILEQTYNYLMGKTENDNGDKVIGDITEDGKTTSKAYRDARLLGDTKSIEHQNTEESEATCLTIYTDYLVSCVEMALAQEYKVINFDFYNDWLNGVIYMPRWMRYIRPKKTYLFGLIKVKSKIKACMDNTSIFSKTRYYTQQCSLSYKENTDGILTDIVTANGCYKDGSKLQKCHKRQGKSLYAIFGGSKNGKKGNGGIVHENETSRGQYVYYIKPCEWRLQDSKKVNLFATDIVLLGSLLDCSLYGIPQAYKYLTSSTYIMPTNLALTNMDDEGQLYAGSAGTICNTSIPIKVPESDVIQNMDRLSEVGSSFSALTNYYSTAADGEKLIYGKGYGDDDITDVFDDTIPLTEAAGIAWNYTGPGQGKKSTDVRNSLYMPGGHFLGISCTNSETNIKSCINLSRICEAGANMSQRREEIRKIVGSTLETEYRYFVPTGLVSNDEVNGGTFRNMFATMNQNRLLCTDRIDEKTGYPIYDFVYLRANGFNGALGYKVENDNNWNQRLNIVDESSILETLARKYGENVTIAKDVVYDNNETAYTATRTTEQAKIDYYKFRLGINDLSEQKKRFLINKSNNTVSLPQYENSFYFYFGLRDGATAFDEFNKQFFSVCDSSSDVKQKMTITKTDEVINMCSFTSNIELTGLNGSGIISGRYEYNGDCGDKVTVELPTVQADSGIFSYNLTNLPFGNYTFIINDEDGSSITTSIEVGKDLVTCECEAYSFEIRTSGRTVSSVIQDAVDSDSGYIRINSLKYYNGNELAELDWNTYKNKLVIIETTSRKYFGSNGSYLPSCLRIGGQITGNVLAEENKLYLWKGDASYDIYLTSVNSNSCRGYTKIASIFVEGIDNFDLYLGSKLLPYSTELKDLTGRWWDEQIGNDGNDGKNWAKRYSLYRRTDFSGDSFTNNIIATNLRNTIVDTVLFGQPEDENGNLLPNVYYEGDNFNISATTYTLSDTSVVPTLLRSDVVLSTTQRTLFGEMAVNGRSVISDKLTTLNGVNFGFDEDRNYFISNYNSNKIKEHHGCIAKLSDGRLLYVVKEGNKFYFDDVLPDVLDNQIVNLYPIFYYPVINRPFYANVFIGDWCNPICEVQTDGSISLIYHRNNGYNASFEIHNGITYKKRFGEITINNNSGLTNSSRSNSNTDATGTNTNGMPTDVIEVYSTSKDNIEEETSYEYVITENGPTSAETFYEKLTSPNQISLIQISDDTDYNFSSTISYRLLKSNSIIHKIKFFKDIEDTENDYYILYTGDSSYNKAMKASSYVYEDSSVVNNGNNFVSGTYYIGCNYTEETDTKLNVYKTSNIFVNKPGDTVFVEITPNGMIIPYLANEGDIQKSGYLAVRDGLQIRNMIANIINNEVDDSSTLYQTLIRFGITPILDYTWNTTNSNSKTFFEGLTLNESSLIDFRRENEDERFDIVVENDSIIWRNEKDFFVIAIKKHENIRSNNKYKKAVNGMGSTIIYRVYENLIKLEPYKESDNPYLDIIPEGTDGIFESE